MPEGDSIFRAARTLHRALAASTVTQFESVLPALMRVADDRPIVGRTIESVTARGKHLLMALSEDLFLHTHMRMNGSWHLYRPGERWHRPAREMRLMIATAKFVAVGFNVPVAEFLSAKDLPRHKELMSLGPDLLATSFDRGEAVARLRAAGSVAICQALLNQCLIAGIGNTLKSEILFVARVYPFELVSQIPLPVLERIIEVSRQLLCENVLTRSQTLTAAIGRRTTRSIDQEAALWVYGRSGKPCRNCGITVLATATGADARSTYWCPQCQPPSFRAV